MDFQLVLANTTVQLSKGSVIISVPKGAAAKINGSQESLSNHQKLKLIFVPPKTVISKIPAILERLLQCHLSPVIFGLAKWSKSSPSDV